MSDRLTRRRLIATGLTAAAGTAGVGAAVRLARKYGLIPPDHAGMYGVGETLTYAAQRLLTSRQSLVFTAGLLLATAGRFRVPIPGAGLAYYYLVVTWATVEGLARYVRFGPPLLWERIEGTR